MELCSLHPLDTVVLQHYISGLVGNGRPVLPDSLADRDPLWAERLQLATRRGYLQAQEGHESGANTVTYGLAQALAMAHPSFAQQGLSLTTLEARIDRGAGMLLRPPSRLFHEAGLSRSAARSMPIRLDLSRGLMGGAYIPARLVPEFSHLLDDRMQRWLRRLADAEYNNVATLGLLIEAADYAGARGLGLYEALDVVIPGAPEASPPGAVVVSADASRIDPHLRKRLVEAAKTPKRPGLLSRMLGRAQPIA